MNLGDALSEQFRLKAVLIRLNWGLAVTMVWLVNCLFVLFARIIFGVYLLSAVHAPKWVWGIWTGHVLSMILIEQIEQKAKK